MSYLDFLFSPNVLFLFHNPIQDTHYIKMSWNFRLLWAVAVSQAYFIYDDLDRFARYWPDILQDAPVLEFV